MEEEHLFYVYIMFISSLNTNLKKMCMHNATRVAYAFDKSGQRGECRGKLKHISDAQMRELQFFSVH